VTERSVALFSGGKFRRRRGMMQTKAVNKSVLTPVEFLNRSMLVYPEKVAVVHGEKRFTYREFFERIMQCL
jgi:non-ribosomal peptide synthetase component E (peptide arylation enzyme)